MNPSQFCAVFVAVLAVCLAVLARFAGEVAIQGPAPGRELVLGDPAAPRWVLGDPAYDFKVLDAPSATGTTLRAIEWVFTRSPIRAPLKRFLLNNNNVVQLRELANQVDTTVSPLVYQPVRRVSPAAHMASAEAAAAKPTLADVLSTPNALPSSQNTPAEQRYWEVTDYAEAYRAGRITPSQAMDRVLAGAREYSHFGAFMSINEDDVRAQARASDARFAAGQPLSVFDGVPIAVKDMLDVKGHVTTFGTRHINGGKPAESDDIAVARFRDLGAIIVGTTVMTEFGVTPVGWNSHHQATFNPYDKNFVSGGSSSGSAVVVALGLVPMAIGADGGGSIRIPAALCGLYGLMPTFNRVPFDTASGTVSTMIHVGPLAATARDAALAYAVMSPVEPGHHFSTLYGGDGPPQPHMQGYGTDVEALEGLRVGVFRPHFDDAPPHMVKAADDAVAWLVAQGAKVVPITIPNLQALQLSHGFGISSEFSVMQDWRYFHDNRADHDLPLEPGTRIQLGLGQAMTSVELIAASKLRGWIFKYLSDLFANEVDVVASPTVGVLTPSLDDATKPSGISDTALVVRMMKYIFLGNLAGFPAVTVPVGYGPGAGQAEDGEGVLPAGVHFMADHWREDLLVGIAARMEAGYAGALRKRPAHFYDVALDTVAPAAE